MNHEIKQYLHGKHGERLALFVAFTDAEGEVRCGFSKKDKKDKKWDDVLSHQIAYGRALKRNFTPLDKIPPSIKNDYLFFLNRVVAYFKMAEDSK